MIHSMESTETYQKPSRKIATVLGFFIPPAGMLYVARPGRAAVYLALMAGIATLDLLVLRERHGAPEAAGLLVMIVCAVQAYRSARDFREIKRPWYSRGPGLIFVLVALSGLTLGAPVFVVEAFRVQSSSMQPSIGPGDRLIVKKWGYGNYGMFGIRFAGAGISSEVSRGDVVVLESPENRSVTSAKRIVGLPGDRIAYFSRRLWVNDQEAPRRQIGDYAQKNHAAGSPQYLERLDGGEYPVLIEAEAPAFVPPAKPFPFLDHCTFTKEGMSCRVPQDAYFVLGDNRDHGDDSRVWGFVPAANIVGKVLLILP